MNAKFILPVLCVALASMASCSKGNVDATNPDDLKDNAITMAENAIAVKESPIIGTIPSVHAQKRAALDSLSEMTKASFEGIDSQNKEEVEEAVANSEKINAAEKSAKDAIQAHYDAKIQEMGKEFIGKEFPSQFDKSQYSAASVKITKFDETSCFAEAKLTLSAPMGKIRCVVYKFLDKQGNTVSNAADYNLDDSGNYGAGGQITIQISASLENMEKITAVKFVKD